MSTLEITTMIGCPLMCTFCPQELLRTSYGKDKEKYLSLETFETVINKLPPHVRIDFSGMAEPWANPNATKMVEIALTKGRTIAVYTTLYGISLKDAEHLVKLFGKYADQVDVICLHLPDEGMNMRGYKGSDTYRKVLKTFLNMSKEHSLSAQKFQVMTMDNKGLVHSDLRDLVPTLAEWSGHTRAGALDEKPGTRPTPRVSAPLTCASTPFYDHNVLLPNGDVVVCCMDYSLRNIIGNLLTMDYWDLFQSPELNRLRIENQKPEFSKCSICKTCENVIKFKMNDDAMMVPDVPKAVPSPAPQIQPSTEISLRDILRYVKHKAKRAISG